MKRTLQEPFYSVYVIVKGERAKRIYKKTASVYACAAVQQFVRLHVTLVKSRVQRETRKVFSKCIGASVPFIVNLLQRSLQRKLYRKSFRFLENDTFPRPLSLVSLDEYLKLL